MKRVLIFARTSTKDQETENQLVQLRHYASAQGWSVVEEIVEVCSGSKGLSDREGFGRVFALAHQRKFDLLLFWALDRFSREGSRATISYLTRLESCGVGWHSFTEPYLSTLGVFSDCIVSLLSTLARQERLRIGERTRAGMQRAKANGKHLGRPKTPSARFEEARRLRSQGLSFSRIGQTMGISKVRAFQLANTDGGE